MEGHYCLALRPAVGQLDSPYRATRNRTCATEQRHFRPRSKINSRPSPRRAEAETRRILGLHEGRWRVMSGPYRPQAFGRPTYIDASASASSSGRDPFDDLLHATESSFFHHDSSNLSLPGKHGSFLARCRCRMTFTNTTMACSLPLARFRIHHPSSYPCIPIHLHRTAIWHAYAEPHATALR